MKHVLTIAGSDTCGGAGIQADLKAMSALGVYGMSVITAVTAQNTNGVFGVQEISKEIIEKQIEVIFEDIRVDAVKIGMLSSIEIIESITKMLKKYNVKNIVIDPVMVSKSKYKLLKDEAIEALKKFVALGTLVTPNIPEAEILADMEIRNEEEMIEAAKKIQNLGAKNVLVKGGHREDNCTDVLLLENGEIVKFPGVRIDTINTHGTGCTLSSSIASLIAKGNSVEEAVCQGKDYITEAIKNSFSIGHGVGPVGHFIDLYKKAGMNYE
ncbi:bifunctional hydroxymethylpyrimidine kinase/phosphomethylpyrimidine kinase [Fusobacterium perfoetens]|uniref:bifunctional hydroxymethylpyrimidine kinase/phosphomethylpyrimidine kinase n=1 Tax=Fusobacterium perfoetens TaxID=852 RepID=UPI000487426F|nr:bifunctional hydroxymethylpyrimidine kinase/phosphomethylpyrimidine kinase [Fusobacterium perfoetens]MCI6151890.1 bifunctional hydroxymethylpyrimidine kinase/phosphomethylpyrimidine kinase [Fusobacterium perfoetens]MDY3238230.1 bifunctional hydroxymethylpyrimidine kinase/phosphomethylpyrimidine kinase [Fusobacterium perfoetens]